MGKLFKSKTTVTQSQNPFETNPWEPQQGYLKEGFEQAGNALSNGIGVLNGVQDYTADMTAGQDNALQQGIGFNQQAGTQGSNLMNQGAGLTHNLNNYAGNANSIYGAASADPTQQIVNNAGQYINNGVLQGQIDAAIGDVNRGFQSQQGQINSAAVGGGNINSTRAGVLESRALDDAQDRAGQIAAGMRGEAYNQGLGLASGNYQQGIQNQLAANQQVAGAGQAGVDTLLAGANLGNGSYNNIYNAETAYQTQNQNEINGQIQQAQQPLDLVSQYMASIGGNYGNKGYTTQTDVKQEGSLFGQITGGIGAIMGGVGAMRK